MTIKNRPYILLVALIVFSTFICGCSQSVNEEVENLPNNTLASLEIENHELDFDSDKTGIYTLVVPNQTSSITLTATPTDNDVRLNYRVSNAEDDSDIITFTSGEKITVDLQEGENIIRFYIGDIGEEEGEDITSDIEADVYLTYTLLVSRPSSDASLSQYVFYTSSDNTESQIPLTPTFDPTVFYYTAEVPYEICNYVSQFYAGESGSTVQVNGKQIDSSEYYYANLIPGENIVDAYVTAAAKTRVERYSFTITRTLPTAAQKEINAKLKSLDIEGSDVDYLCGQSSYGISVNKNADHIVITAIPEVAGAKLRIKEMDVLSGVATEIPLTEDETFITLSVVASNGSSSKSYTLYIDRQSSNIVEVDTTQELQTALKNANPSDLIIVAPGVYYGLASTTTSGSEKAHFYSNRSGSALNPIYLTVETSDEETALEGDFENNTSVLLLEGDYWQVTGLEIRNANQGIILNNAHHNTLFGLDVNSITEHAVSISQGSSDNRLLDSELSVSSDTDFSTNAALVQVISDQNSSTTGNIIRRNTLTSGADKVALLLAAGTQHNTVENNRFDILEQSSVEQIQPQLTIEANNTIIRFNTFYPMASNDTTAPIHVNTVPQSSMPSGDNTVIYQNWMKSESETLPFVFSESGENLRVGENYYKPEDLKEDDAIPVTYSGKAVQEAAVSSPRYQIRLADNDELCIAAEEIDELYFGLVKKCEDNPLFYWQLELSDDHYTYIRNMGVDEDDNYFMASTDFVSYCESIATATSFNFLTSKLVGYAQQWGLYDNSRDSSLYIVNKRNTAYGLTVAGATYTENTPSVVCPLVGNKRQHFMLIEVP
ncbi:cadherin-like beta sandwich domain-containing protein [Teredinibacter haidensis]|uniref:cadherin-like beta sandwich domain-containing protein n=1 Tax=Teredinibacter haidensis TaxID=2731755 RepID=UPI000948BDCA|nr:cadherin-like beta sandwich domain-containing protein [Teredinibacter haidensis]